MTRLDEFKTLNEDDLFDLRSSEVVLCVYGANRHHWYRILIGRKIHNLSPFLEDIEDFRQYHVSGRTVRLANLESAVAELTGEFKELITAQNVPKEQP